MSRRSLPLTERLTALRDALDAADEHLEGLEPGRALLAKAGARIALGEATVVALAGSTGSGKSTLFNALAGAEISTPGVRRPTTGTAHAVVWGAADPSALLDWLQVPRRHVHDRSEPALDGLVLLDLPDHDSVRSEHRLEVDRLVELVDVLVWVMDPQKYADAAVHDRYLTPYAGHAGVLMVVLNQADRLDPTALAACLADLRRLLATEGLGAVPVLTTSGLTGLGLDELRAELARRVAARRAASDRLVSDVRAEAGRLSEACGDGRIGEVGKGERRRLVEALSDAAGVPQVERAVRGSVQARATASTGWPPLRWVRNLRPDPLRRLHLSGSADERVRTSLAAAGGVQSARVQDAVRAARDAAGDGLPAGWRESLRSTVQIAERGLPDRLDRAVAGTHLGADRVPLWWRGVGALQWLLLATALIGALWLLALVGLSYLQLDGILPVPRVERFPVPTLLLVTGLLSGLLLAVLCRPLTGATANRRARTAGKRLRERVAAVAQVEVLTPITEHRATYERFCTAIRKAGS